MGQGSSSFGIVFAPAMSRTTKHGSEMSWQTDSDTRASLLGRNTLGDIGGHLTSDLETGRVASRSLRLLPGVPVSQQKFRGKEDTP